MSPSKSAECRRLYFNDFNDASAVAMGKVLFHLAFPVTDLDEAKRFYVEGLGCELGRESAKSLILGFLGHQIVAQLSTEPPPKQKGIYPRHFGLVFTSEEDWQALADLAKSKGLKFYQHPRTRFAGTRLEHLTFFLEDPFHNLLEFKHYKYDSAIFGEHGLAEVGDSEEAR
jgi:extradiol dioxygenase family protein